MPQQITLYVKSGFMVKAKEFFVLLGFWQAEASNSEDLFINGEGEKIKLVEYSEPNQSGLRDKIPCYVFSVNDIQNVVSRIQIWLQEFCADNEWEIFLGTLVQYKIRVNKVFSIEIGLNSN